jgi:hypothetical protein
LTDGRTGHAVAAGSAADQWIGAHAAQFGLMRPVGSPGGKHWEPWHVELADGADTQGFKMGASQMGAMAGADVGQKIDPLDMIGSYMDVISGAHQDALALGTPGLDVAAPTVDISTPEPGVSANYSFAPNEPIKAPEATGTSGSSQPMSTQDWEGAMPGVGYAPPGTGVDRWRPVMEAAMRYTGVEPTPDRVALGLRRMAQESGGNPFAVNNWDSNAKRGDPTSGLMQNIPSAFTSRAKELANRGVFDGFANIVASIRYTLARYGSLEAGWGRKGGY